jgi:hypothetical protein
MTLRLLVRGRRLRTACAAGVLLTLAGVDMLGQPRTIASVAYVDGKVEVFRYGSTVPMPAEVGMALRQGDEIRTRKGGKCQLNFTTTGILRLPPDFVVLFPTRDNVPDTPPGGRRLLKSFVGLAVGLPLSRLKQMYDDPEIFKFEPPEQRDSYVPPPPDVVAARAKEDAARVDQTPEGLAVAEYLSLLAEVLQVERKPWHTRFEFLANAVKTGNGYRVAYKTYCLIEKGPDTGKDYVCFELDTVLDIGAVKTAIADMKRRLGR